MIPAVKKNYGTAILSDKTIKEDHAVKINSYGMAEVS